MTTLSTLEPHEELMFLLSVDSSHTHLPRDMQTKLLNGWLQRNDKNIQSIFLQTDLKGLKSPSNEAFEWILKQSRAHPNLSLPWEIWADEDVLWNFPKFTTKIEVLSNALSSLLKQDTPQARKKLKDPTRTLIEFLGETSFHDLKKNPEVESQSLQAIDVVLDVLEQPLSNMLDKESFLFGSLDEEVTHWYIKQRANDPRLKGFESYMTFQKCTNFIKESSKKTLVSLKNDLLAWKGQSNMSEGTSAARDQMWSKAFKHDKPDALDVLNQVLDQAPPHIKTQLLPDPVFMGLFFSRNDLKNTQNVVSWCTQRYSDEEKKVLLRSMMNKVTSTLLYSEAPYVRRYFNRLNKVLKCMKKDQWDVSSTPLQFSVSRQKGQYANPYHLGYMVASNLTNFFKSEPLRKTLEKSISLLHPSFGGFFHVLSQSHQGSWSIPHPGVFEVKPLSQANLRELDHREAHHFDKFMTQYDKFFLTQKTASATQKLSSAPKRKM